MDIIHLNKKQSSFIDVDRLVDAYPKKSIPLWIPKNYDNSVQKQNGKIN